MGSCCITWELSAVLCGKVEGWDGVGGGGRIKRKGTYVYLHLIHIVVRQCVRAKLLQLCLPLCDPMDCSLPVYSIHGILQTRILEWVAMPSSRGSSPPRDPTCVSYVS